MSLSHRPHLRIVYWRFSGFTGHDAFVGGVETYLQLLAECCSETGMPMILYQCAEKPFQRTIGQIIVKGVQTPTLTNTDATRNRLSKEAFKDLDFKRDILLYGSDEWSLKTDFSRAISIQHGIAWDRPIQFLSNKAFCRNNNYMERLKRWKARRRALSFFENCRNRVCVDYNFLNWYRTYRTVNHTSRVWVIPNAAPALHTDRIDAKLGSVNESIRILFARRFEPFRGTRLMAAVTTELLKKYPHVGFTFAGDGSDRKWLQERFKDEPRVAICKVDYSQRMETYFQHDIVAIPSYGSEGTSLSAIEAMSAGCATVATDSGGLTNLILDGYNGILIPPQAADLERSLILLIENNDLRKKIASAGHATAQSSFSVKLWKTRWHDVLSEVATIR